MSHKNRISASVRQAALATALCFSSAAVLADSAPPVPPSLDDLRNMRMTGPTEVEAALADQRNLRGKAMQEAALSYGARSGLLRRSYEIAETVKYAAPSLDAALNFTPRMLVDLLPGEKSEGRSRIIVPPVLEQAGHTLNQLGPQEVRSREGILKFHANARISTTVPNWREYLTRDLGERTATPPHATLLPRTSEERANWDKWLAEGFAAGKEQADSIFEADVARLRRDLLGMDLYHSLVLQKVVSLPFVATRNDGVTGNGQQLNINDVTLRITVLPAFQTNPKEWTPTGTLADQTRKSKK